ncbi:MAG: YihY/virulence factor BrkB family protein [Gemmatimonadales bacterium]
MAEAPPHLAESPPGGGLSAAVASPSLLAQIVAALDRVKLPLLASALTFDALLAIIPLAVLIVALLSWLLSSTSLGTNGPGELFARFLPAHAHGVAADPFTLIEQLVAKIEGWNRSKLTWVAVPLFVWFSSRLFAAVRICLSQVFQVRQRPVRGHFVWSYIAGYLLAKGQDVVIALIVMTLAIANTVTTTTLGIAAARGVEVDPRWSFLLTTGGQWAARGVAFLFGIALFVLLYRYASPKRLAWSGALIASAVATLGFEVAKRLYGLYLVSTPHGGQYAIDTDLGAALLFILWMWYMSFVFLIGAAVADVWDRARAAQAVEHARGV